MLYQIYSDTSQREREREREREGEREREKERKGGGELFQMRYLIY